MLSWPSGWRQQFLINNNMYWGKSCHCVNFVTREIKNRGALAIHEPHCKLNPNRTKKQNSENAHRPKGLAPWNKGLTKDDDPRILRGANTLRKILLLASMFRVAQHTLNNLRLFNPKEQLREDLAGILLKTEHYETTDGDAVFCNLLMRFGLPNC